MSSLIKSCFKSMHRGSDRIKGHHVLPNIECNPPYLKNGRYMKYTSSKVLKLLAQKCLQRDQKHDILNQDLN